MKIYVGGINGSGKTSILKSVAQLLGFEYIHLTHQMMQKLGFPLDYDKLRLYPNEEKTRIREEILGDLISVQDRNVIIDSHYMNLIRGRTNPVTGPAMDGFDVFVLISAPIDQVWQRIHKDEKNRNRALFPENILEEESFEMLKKYQEETKKEFLRLAEIHQKKNIEIVNEDGRLESSIEELVDFLKQC